MSACTDNQTSGYFLETCTFESVATFGYFTLEGKGGYFRQVFAVASWFLGSIALEMTLYYVCICDVTA